MQTQGYQSTISLVLCGSAPGYPPPPPTLPPVPGGRYGGPSVYPPQGYVYYDPVGEEYPEDHDPGTGQGL